MAMVSGGELLVRTLMKAKVNRLFGIHGAHVDTIFQSALDHQIPITDTRHEAAAGHAAEAYARMTRDLGVALVTAGPGFTNIVTSIANAHLDRTPVLYLAGSAGVCDAETNTLQAGVDQVAVAKPITKWAHRIGLTAQIPRLVAEAIRLATSAPTGPVLLDLPADVLAAQIDEDAVSIPETIQLESPAAPTPAAVESALELLMSAKRPIIMLGAGAYFSCAPETVRKFVETTGIPVFSDFQAHGLLPSSHPLYGGTYHKLADLAAPGGRPDVVLALGVRFGLFTLGTNGMLVPTDAKIIHIETDPREIGLVRPVTVPMVADPERALTALLAASQDHNFPNFTSWQSAVRMAKSDRKARAKADLDRTSQPIHPYQAVSAIADAIDKDTIVIGDGAEAYHWMNETIRQDRPGSYITHGFLGTMGFGLGLAIGAQTASPDRRVLCLVGDGAVGFNIAEFDTMIRHRLPIVVVVMNNHSWGASQHFQEVVAGANRVTGTTLRDAHYHDVAAAFGCLAERVVEIGRLVPAIRAAFASGRPACINVTVDLTPPPPELRLLMSPQ